MAQTIAVFARAGNARFTPADAGCGNGAAPEAPGQEAARDSERREKKRDAQASVGHDVE